MTPKERTYAVAHCRETDRIPMTLNLGAMSGLCSYQQQLFSEKTGSDNPDSYFDFDIRNVNIELTSNGIDRSYFKEELPVDVIIGPWGIASRTVASPHFEFERTYPPLKQAETLREIEEFPTPGYSIHKKTEEIDRLKKQGYVVASYSGSLYEWSWWLRGHQQFMIDMLSEPLMAEAIIEKVASLTEKMAVANACAGIEVICFYDDVGMQKAMQISPDLWRKMIKPHWERIFQRVRSVSPDTLLFLHSCGMIEEVIGDFVDMGLNFLHPVQPECMDPARIRRRFGKNLAFWGTISNQHTMPFGTPEDVRREVELRIRTLNPGLIVSPSNVLGPEVPWENIMTLMSYWTI